jgi:hypothetical protein
MSVFKSGLYQCDIEGPWGGDTLAWGERGGGPNFDEETDTLHGILLYNPSTFTAPPIFIVLVTSQDALASAFLYVRDRKPFPEEHFT